MSSRHVSLKREKEKFLMFTRVLIKYLEQKDKEMHARAKSIIKDCAERNKRKEPGYESVTNSMKKRLRQLVGDTYWKKATEYLLQILAQKRRQAAAMTPQQQQEHRRRMQQRNMMQAQGSSSQHQQPSSSQQQQLQQAQAQQRQAQAKTKKEQVMKQRTTTGTVAPPSLSNVPKGIQAKQREQQQQQQPSASSPMTTGASSSAPTTAKASSSKSKSKSASASSKTSGADAKTSAKSKTTKKVVRRKSTDSASARKSTTAKAAATSSTTNTIIKRVREEENKPPREYKELMEAIDHAVEYDWPSLGQLLGNKADLKLTDEERQLLYGDNPPESLMKKKAIKSPAKAVASLTGPAGAGTKAFGTNSQDPSSSDPAASEEQQNNNKANKNRIGEDGVRPGWGKSNVLSARAAWARVRLKEVARRKREAKNHAPVVADGLLTLPSPAVRPPKQDASAATTAGTTPVAGATAAAVSSGTPVPGTDTTDSTATPPAPLVLPEGYWVNEETAEQDKALALLSEGCQIYLKGALQKAIQCARQRQNLDGIRLWHQQYMFSKGTTSVTASASSSKDSKSKSVDKSKKPPLSLRLGCDVSRQVFQAHGNAALTVKRMEEALDRQVGIPMHVRQLNSETLLEATSMGDLSWRPPLKKGADKADTQAKRFFEIYGGKEAKDPPLGRVPKKAKLIVEDFVMGSELSVNGPFHKAHTVSSSITF